MFKSIFQKLDSLNISYDRRIWDKLKSIGFSYRELNNIEKSDIHENKSKFVLMIKNHGMGFEQWIIVNLNIKNNDRYALIIMGGSNGYECEYNRECFREIGKKDQIKYYNEFDLLKYAYGSREQIYIPREYVNRNISDDEIKNLYDNYDDDNTLEIMSENSDNDMEDNTSDEDYIPNMEDDYSDDDYMKY